MVFYEHTVLSKSHHPAPAARPVSTFIWAVLTLSCCEKGWQLILSALQANTKAGFPACFLILLRGDEGLCMKRHWLMPAVLFAAEDGSQLKHKRHLSPGEPVPSSETWNCFLSIGFSKTLDIEIVNLHLNLETLSSEAVLSNLCFVPNLCKVY